MSTRVRSSARSLRGSVVRVLGLVLVATINSCAHPVSHEEIQTRNLVIHLAKESQWFGAAGKSLSGGGIEEFLRRVEEEELLDADARRVFPGLTDGTDGWDRKLIVELRGNVVHIRSKGRDGVDQKGAGDDVEAFVDYKDSSAMITVVPALP